jgi:hypothetical protein
MNGYLVTCSKIFLHIVNRVDVYLGVRKRRGHIFFE